jgi:hypothetical protein
MVGPGQRRPRLPGDPEGGSVVSLDIVVILRRFALSRRLLAANEGGGAAQIWD